MRSEVRESEDLCLRILELLERDGQELSRSLEGEILDAYRRVIQAELKQMREVRGQLLRARETEF